MTKDPEFTITASELQTIAALMIYHGATLAPELTRTMTTLKLIMFLGVKQKADLQLLPSALKILQLAMSDELKIDYEALERLIQ